MHSVVLLVLEGRAMRLVESLRHLAIVLVVVLHDLLEILLTLQFRAGKLDNPGKAVWSLARLEYGRV